MLSPMSRILRVVYYIIFVIMWGMVNSEYPLFVKFMNSLTMYAFMFFIAGQIEAWRIRSNENPSGSGKA